MGEVKSRAMPSAMEAIAAKEKLLYAKLYKIVAVGLCIGAIIVLGLIYDDVLEGNPFKLFEKPFLLCSLLFPFVPAYFLAILSKKRRAEALEVLEPDDE